MQRIHTQGILFAYFHAWFLKEVVHIDKRVGLPPSLSPHSKYYQKPHKSFHTFQTHLCNTKGALYHSEAFYLSHIHTMHFLYLYFSKKQRFPSYPRQTDTLFFVLWGVGERRIEVEKQAEKARLVGFWNAWKWGRGKFEAGGREDKGIRLILIKCLSGTVSAAAC